MARPVKKETPYKLIIHAYNGHRYASTKIREELPDGKIVYKHKHWGKLDENNKFYPNVSYFYLSPEERSKLIFPSDWDLSLLKELDILRPESDDNESPKQ